MKSKRIIAMLTLAAMAVSMTACGDTKTSADSTVSETTESATETMQTTEATENTEDSVEIAENTETTTDAVTDTESSEIDIVDSNNTNSSSEVADSETDNSNIGNNGSGGSSNDTAESNQDSDYQDTGYENDEYAFKFTKANTSGDIGYLREYLVNEDDYEKIDVGECFDEGKSIEEWEDVFSWTEKFQKINGEKYTGYFTDKFNFDGQAYWLNGEDSAKIYIEIGESGAVSAFVLTDIEWEGVTNPVWIQFDTEVRWRTCQDLSLVENLSTNWFTGGGWEARTLPWNYMDENGTDRLRIYYDGDYVLTIDIDDVNSTIKGVMICPVDRIKDYMSDWAE